MQMPRSAEEENTLTGISRRSCGDGRPGGHVAEHVAAAAASGRRQPRCSIRLGAGARRLRLHLLKDAKCLSCLSSVWQRVNSLAMTLFPMGAIDEQESHLNRAPKPYTLL
jgi:hypothetical protein